MTYISLFFAGAFLCNSIPHLAAGLRGEPFPTPFAKPSGIGKSSPLVNFLWGASNIAIGALLLSQHPFSVSLNLDCLTFAAGVLLLGTYLSLHFGNVRRNAEQ